MKNVLEYKGYYTKVEFDSEAFVVRGKIEGIKDLVNFECTDLSLVEQEFHTAVDEYLEFCKEIGKEPDKEYRGTFNIRINPELHKKLVVVAMKNGDTLNATVEKAIKKYVSAQYNVKQNENEATHMCERPFFDSIISIQLTATQKYPNPS